MVLGGHSAGSMHGYWLSGAWSGCGIQHDEAWRNRASDSIVCRMGIRSPSSARKRPYAGCSVIRTCGSSISIGAQKNRLRRLWAAADGVVRPAPTTGTVICRVPGSASSWNSKCGAWRAAPVRRAARAAGFPGGQPTLHQAVSPSMFGRRCRQASIRDVAQELKLDWDTVKIPGDAAYARPDRARWHAGIQGDWHRRDLDPQGLHNSRIAFSDLDLQTADLVSGGDDRSEASMAQFYNWLGPDKSSARAARRDGHVEAVPQRRAGQKCRRQRSCSTSSTSCAISARRSTRCVRPNTRDCAARTGTLSSGAEIYTLLSHRDNLTLDGKRSLTLLLAANKRLNTAYTARGLRPALGLPPRGLGAPLLRQLARQPQAAAAQAVTSSLPT